MTLEGAWRCEDTEVERELFSFIVVNRITYSGDGTYLGKYDFDYDFPSVGPVSATLLLPGTWQLDGNVLIESSGQGRIIDVNTTTEIPERDVAEELLKQFPADEVFRLRLTFLSNDRVEMFDLGEDAEDAYFCERERN